MWLLLTVTQQSLLEKCVSYKDKLAKGLSADAGSRTMWLDGAQAATRNASWPTAFTDSLVIGFPHSDSCLYRGALDLEPLSRSRRLDAGRLGNGRSGQAEQDGAKASDGTAHR